METEPPTVRIADIKGNKGRAGSTGGTQFVHKTGYEGGVQADDRYLGRPDSDGIRV